MALFTETNLGFITCLQAPLLPHLSNVQDRWNCPLHVCIPVCALVIGFRFFQDFPAFTSSAHVSFLKGSVNKLVNCAIRRAMLLLEWYVNCQPLFNTTAFSIVLINLSMVIHYHLHKLLCKIGSLLKNMQTHVFWPYTDYPSSLINRLS